MSHDSYVFVCLFVFCLFVCLLLVVFVLVFFVVVIGIIGVVVAFLLFDEGHQASKKLPLAYKQLPLTRSPSIPSTC